MKTLHVDLKERGYDILIGAGLLAHAGEELDLNRRVLIVTDDGVPARYAKAVAAQCAMPLVASVAQGEESKSFERLTELLMAMKAAGFTRGDAVAAVGGGMAGDLAGFTAACYMRGVDFYNLPTTVLSQVDSSVGGKTAVNLGGVKNLAGAFYQPKKVLIDTDTLQTLSSRQRAEGLAEALKMSVTSDPALFELFEEKAGGELPMEEIIAAALEVKISVVEQDEKESGLRRILNFGHTIGHGVEAAADGALFHGESVALGMIPFCADSVRERLIPVLEKLGLPTRTAVDRSRVMEAVSHDKKAADKGILTVWAPEIGKAEIRRMTLKEIEALLPLIEEGGENG